MSISQTKVEYKKILLLGLNDAGKTSILLTLKKECNLLSFLSLKPTKKISIEDFVSEFEDQGYSVWDFGGQEQYRGDYLQNFDKYIKGAQKVIFVIDVQDIERYDLALNYLYDIIRILNEMGVKIEFSIFFHKYDPNLKKMEKFKNIDQLIEKNLVEKIKEKMIPDFNYSVYKTSIYTVFDKSLLNA